MSLLDYYKWNKFSIIYEDTWRTVAQSLVQQANKKNMTINDEKSAKDRHKCCEEKLNCCGGSYWYQFIQDTKNRTRSILEVLASQFYNPVFSLRVFGDTIGSRRSNDYHANCTVVRKWGVYGNLCWYEHIFGKRSSRLHLELVKYDCNNVDRVQSRLLQNQKCWRSIKNAKIWSWMG